MNKTALFILSFLATVPVLFTPFWWCIPIQVVACGLAIVVHASSGVAPWRSMKLSMFYAGVCFLGLACVSSLTWPWALLASIGSHFLGVLLAGLLMGRGDVKKNDPLQQEWIPRDDPRRKTDGDDVRRIL